jgi:hypothetical protein
VKIYELVKGEASEVPIDERGAVGGFKTITPIELKAVEQFLEDLCMQQMCSLHNLDFGIFRKSKCSSFSVLGSV